MTAKQKLIAALYLICCIGIMIYNGMQYGGYGVFVAVVCAIIVPPLIHIDRIAIRLFRHLRQR